MKKAGVTIYSYLLLLCFEVSFDRMGTRLEEKQTRDNLKGFLIFLG